MQTLRALAKEISKAIPGSVVFPDEKPAIRVYRGMTTIVPEFQIKNGWVVVDGDVPEQGNPELSELQAVVVALKRVHTTLINHATALNVSELSGAAQCSDNLSVKPASA